MNYFTTELEAREWADSYGLPYPYSVQAAAPEWSDVGLFVVVWDYREPRGC